MTNITLEQIALEVSEELQAGYPPKVKGEDQIVEFLRRCLAKLGEVKVEPVAHMNPCGGVLQRLSTGLERNTFTIPLYTSDQIAIIQQQVAEACAKVCMGPKGSDGNIFADDAAAYIRTGEWRKYLKGE